MIDSDPQIRSTVELLRSASVDRFVRAVASLEQGAAVPGVTEIKERIRDRMAKVRPPRPVTLMRIFCLPFEDMLRNEVGRDATGIPRSAIQPCWRLVIENANPVLLRRFEQQVRDLAHDDSRAIEAVGPPLWAEITRVLGDATAAARAGDPAALARFKDGGRLVDHAELMAAACQVGPALECLKAGFPDRPIKSLQLENRDALRAELTRIAGEGQDDLRCIIHVVAHWTASPAEIFDLTVELDLGRPTPLGRAVTALRDKVVIGALAEQVASLRTALDGDAPALAGQVEILQIATDSLEAASGLLKKEGGSNEAGHGLGKFKRELASMVRDRVLVDAAEALNTAWAARGAAEPRPARDVLVSAEAAARAMRKCDRLGPVLGIESAVAKKIKSTLAAVRGAVSQAIADGSESSIVESALSNATRILEILEGPDQAFKFFKEKKALLRAPR
jgi:hypothetical protein